MQSNSNDELSRQLYRACATESGSYEEFQRLLEEGADPNYSPEFMEGSRFRQKLPSAMDIAISRGDFKVCKLLKTHGGEGNPYSTAGCYPWFRELRPRQLTMLGVNFTPVWGHYHSLFSEKGVDYLLELARINAHYDTDVILLLIVKMVSVDKIREFIELAGLGPKLADQFCSELRMNKTSPRHIPCSEWPRGLHEHVVEDGQWVHLSKTTLLHAAVCYRRHDLDVLHLLVEEYEVAVDGPVHYCGGSALDHAMACKHKAAIEYLRPLVNGDSHTKIQPSNVWDFEYPPCCDPCPGI